MILGDQSSDNLNGSWLMYLPDHFKENDKEEIVKLIEEFPLATLICFLEGEFIANHIPLLHDKGDEYVGHIAKANLLHEFFPEGTKALAIFKAEDSYISPNLYPTKLETHRHVPTWNYQVVHLHGNLSFIHLKKDKIAIVGKLTKQYERIYSGEEEWKMADAPKDYMDQMIENIVGFRFKVDRVSAKSKLSQNREDIDFLSVQNAMGDLNKTFLENAMDRLVND
jgi:transcriptional regulator